MVSGLLLYCGVEVYWEVVSGLLLYCGVEVYWEVVSGLLLYCGVEVYWEVAALLLHSACVYVTTLYNKQLLDNCAFYPFSRVSTTYHQENNCTERGQKNNAA